MDKSLRFVRHGTLTTILSASIFLLGLLAPDVRAQQSSASAPPTTQPAATMEQMEQDWLFQDLGAWQFRPEAIEKPLAELGQAGADLAKEYRQLKDAHTAATDAHWRDLYRRACLLRRAAARAAHAEPAETRLRQASIRAGRVALRLHRGPVRRPGRAPLLPPRGPVRPGSRRRGQAARRPHAPLRRPGHAPRPGRLV